MVRSFGEADTRSHQRTRHAPIRSLISNDKRADCKFPTCIFKTIVLFPTHLVVIRKSSGWLLRHRGSCGVRRTSGRRIATRMKRKSLVSRYGGLTLRQLLTTIPNICLPAYFSHTGRRRLLDSFALAALGCNLLLQLQDKYLLCGCITSAVEGVTSRKATSPVKRTVLNFVPKNCRSKRSLHVCLAKVLSLTVQFSRQCGQIGLHTFVTTWSFCRCWHVDGCGFER